MTLLNEKIKLLSVVGPTASGKTSLAVQLALQTGGEVVSCDSMQIYKGMPIATATPTLEEMQGVPHHLMAFLEPTQSFSVAEYCRLADSAIEDIYSRGKMPILCGGTGLYYNSVVDGIAFADVPEMPQLREQLQLRAQAEGGRVLLDELASFDSECAAKFSEGDIKRIIRAIEVYRATGVTMTEHIRNSRTAPPKYDLCAMGIAYRDRQTLYDRINRRVDAMLEEGLLEEAKRFFDSLQGKTSVQAIGYKELKPFLDNKCSFEDAVEKLKMETRRYAKRQLSWFRRDDRIKWIYADDCDCHDEIYHRAAEIAKEFIDG
ncbi:MAG: tRNA (adenosine(37)-N6)-dimethylallyltransferase MiaA [Clostridia bacterium]|nr:tRNA (adenosine(37)-N6)-dimethylallyltransferase MiaA [Clostridia bacterium]